MKHHFVYPSWKSFSVCGVYVGNSGTIVPRYTTCKNCLRTNKYKKVLNILRGMYV